MDPLTSQPSSFATRRKSGESLCGAKTDVSRTVAIRVSAWRRLAAIDAGFNALPLTVALGKALWTDNRNLADEAVVRGALVATLLPAGLLDKARAPSHADTLVANTEDAVRAKVFGVPSCVVGDEVFWGQDRLDFVERALGSGED